MEFEHNLKPKKKKRRKRKANLSLNQSRKKRRKYNYGEIVRIKKCDVEEDKNKCNTEEESDGDDGVQSNKLNVTHYEIERIQNIKNNTVNVSLDSSNEHHLNQAESNESEKTYLENCLDKCTNELIKLVLQNFDKEGLLIHFMAFMSMIANGQLSVANMAVLLCMELGLLFSLASTTQMRYREDTSLFWEVVLSVGGLRTLRLFSSDKHQGTVNSRECECSKYNPQKGSFKFAVLDEKLLRKSKNRITKMCEMWNNRRKYVSSRQGKRICFSS